MSEEQLKAFLEKVKGDTSLKEKLKAAADANAVVEIAKDAGFMIATDELNDLTQIRPVIAASDADTLSDQELEAAVGGKQDCRTYTSADPRTNPDLNTGHFTSPCACSTAFITCPW